MQFTSIVAIAVASVATVVVADSCNQGGVYCGESLLNKGNYHDHIVQVLQANGQPTDDAHINDSLFNCLGGGEITFQGFCQNGCGGVSSQDPDYCL